MFLRWGGGGGGVRQFSGGTNFVFRLSKAVHEFFWVAIVCEILKKKHQRQPWILGSSLFS